MLASPQSSTRWSRRTISRATDPIRGIGLFTGVPCSVKFLPGGPEPGLWLRSGPDTVPLTIGSIDAAAPIPNVPPGFPVRNSTVAIAGRCVGATVEHAMSALAGLGISDAVAELDGPEFPILDGSAAPFAHALAPLVVPTGPDVSPYSSSTQIRVEDPSGAYISLAPGPGFTVSYTLDYGPGAPLHRRTVAWRGEPQEFLTDIAPARTFSLEHEVALARSAGLFRGFSPQDLLVIADSGLPIDNTWLWPDEAARHKLLDLIGDLALVGRPIQGIVRAVRSGHALTHRFCRVLLQACGS